MTNARVHASAYELLRVDIENFFPAIAQARIESLLLGLGVQGGAARVIGELCTLNGVLPLGLQASPLLANLACLNLDYKLLALAESCGCSVTRYADDVAFSGNTVPTLDAAGELLRQEGFGLSRSKCRMTRRGQAHFVTGLSISDSQPRVPKRMKRGLRQELYFAHKFGLLGHLSHRSDTDRQAAVNRIDGTIRYVNAVEPQLAARLSQHWQAILKSENLAPAYAPRTGRRAPVTLVVDETEIDTSDGRILAIGIVMFTEREYIRRELDDLLRAHLVDPCATGDKASLQASGLVTVQPPV